MSAENLLRILDEVSKIEHFISQEFFELLIDICNQMSHTEDQIEIEALNEGYHILYDLVIKRFDTLNGP